MTWTNFLLILLMIYLAYYGLNVVFDLFTARSQPSSENDQDVLFFNEDSTPELIIYEEEQQITAAPAATSDNSTEPLATVNTFFTSGLLQSSGAVGIKELLNLAKDNLIEYTRAIPY